MSWPPSRGRSPTRVTGTSRRLRSCRSPTAPPLTPQRLESQKNICPSVLLGLPSPYFPSSNPSVTHIGFASKAHPQCTCCSPWSQPPSPLNGRWNRRSPPNSWPPRFRSCPTIHSPLRGHSQLLNMQSQTCHTPLVKTFVFRTGAFNPGFKGRVCGESLGVHELRWKTITVSVPTSAPK